MSSCQEAEPKYPVITDTLACTITSRAQPSIMMFPSVVIKTNKKIRTNGSEEKNNNHIIAKYRQWLIESGVQCCTYIHRRLSIYRTDDLWWKTTLQIWMLLQRIRSLKCRDAAYTYTAPQNIHTLTVHPLSIVVDVCAKFREISSRHCLVFALSRISWKTPEPKACKSTLNHKNTFLGVNACHYDHYLWLLHSTK